ncbi:MAG TPA: hypothetical protein VNE41_03275 [Chitinophagaceae bacterium]|nr:hypothetical protein [Chitinophagaceae bacterium]
MGANYPQDSLATDIGNHLLGGSSIARLISDSAELTTSLGAFVQFFGPAL